MLICGATTTETSQNAGRLGIGGNAWGRVGVGTKPTGSGGWNVPPGKDLAFIEVTSGTSKLAKPSQFAAAEAVGKAATAPSRTAEHDSILNPLTMISLPFLTSFTLSLVALEISGHALRRHKERIEKEGRILTAWSDMLPRTSSPKRRTAARWIQARGNKVHACGDIRKFRAADTPRSKRFIPPRMPPQLFLCIIIHTNMKRSRSQETRCTSAEMLQIISCPNARGRRRRKN
jgi:hypothetical protein